MSSELLRDGVETLVAGFEREAADRKIWQAFRSLCRDGDEAAKLLMFMMDPYFLEAARFFPPGPERDHAANQACGLLLKPEAIRPHRLDFLAQELRHQGFRVVACERFEMTRSRSLEFWRYQTNAATPERQFLMTFYLQGCHTHYLVLRQETGLDEGGRNACDRFQATKGKSQLSRRGARHLRTRLGGASAILNGLHATDHPFDLVRDLGILGEPFLAETARVLAGRAEPSFHGDVRALALEPERRNGAIPQSYEQAFESLAPHFDGPALATLEALRGTRRRIRLDTLEELARQVPREQVAAFAVFMGGHIDYILRGSKNFL